MKFIAVLLLAFLACTFAAPSTTAVGGEIECTICTFVVGRVENYLEGNATEAQILGFLEKDCAFLGSLNQTCVTLVAAYGPAIITDLINTGNPQTVCSDVGLCSSKKVKAVGDAFDCPVCEWVVGEMEALVANNQTESEILTFVENECTILVDQTWISLCQSIVSTYGPQLIQDLLNEATPLAACTDIGFCGNSSSSSSDSSQSGSSSDSSDSSNSGSSQSGSATAGPTGTSGFTSSGSSGNSGNSGNSGSSGSSSGSSGSSTHASVKFRL